MMRFIAESAKAIRQEKGFSHAHVAAARGVRESTIVRFESGKTRQTDVDAMIDAYATVTGVPAIEFWERALDARRAALKSDESTPNNRRSNGNDNPRRGQRHHAPECA